MKPFFCAGLGCITLAAAIPVVPKDCKHGEWENTTESCKCYEGWTKSGITDTVNFMAGICDQYECISDEKCQSHLGIEGATCPIAGWNCYCGWKYAMKNDGHGYETSGRGGGACMGTMFTFSFWVRNSSATEQVELVAEHTWKVFALCALLLLPFGRKRVNCDHHMPSMWRSLRDLFGAQACHGECLAVDQYSFTMFKDDFAWSIYILDLAFWAYAFLLVTYAITLFVWSILLWAMVLLAFLTMMIAGVFAACGEGGAACCNGATCSCDGCCTGCDACFPIAPSAAPGSVDVFYWGGPYPYSDCSCLAGTGTGDECSCCCGCSWRCCCSCCFPIAWMLFVFPRAPENAWGGLLGRAFGTHSLTAPERLYQGCNAAVEFFGMSWRRGADLHSDDNWRRDVFNFLSGNFDAEDVHDGQSLQPLVQADGELRPVIAVGKNNHAIIINRPFDKVKDACVESSFNDYAENKCWICQDDTNCEFDLWLNCHHIFCSRCSSEMLRRSMPCPLCRVASTSVLRGTSFSGPRLLSPKSRSPKRRTRESYEEGKGAKLLEAPRQGEF